VIIEPFAGSARYALKYFDRDVILIDKYSVIAEIWKYLQQASEKDILSLPRIESGQNLDSFQSLTKIEKQLIGFCINGGSAQPKKQASHCNWNKNQKDIARQLFKIRHWKIINGEYDCLANTEATWFIDPPYFQGGEYYIHSTKQINFSQVSEWAQTRNGQVIVCENSSATWMPFTYLSKLHGTIKTTTEVFWTNEKVETQASLF
jgi:hypothetical protein